VYLAILKTTGRYMMTANVDTSDGFVNGATGVLREMASARTTLQIFIGYNF